MKKTYKWGILGLGRIAHKFVTDLQSVPNAEVYAVASSSAERAATFGERYGATHRLDNYAALAALEDVDIIYIATPHAFHYEQTMLCLRARKHVLCEKPFAMDKQQAQAMVDYAREHGLFLMEALWTRFIPLFQEALQLIERGVIGEVQTVKADFGFKADWFSQDSRIWNPKLGGGALLDIGIYPLYLATLLFGKPTEMKASATFSESGVDDNFAAVLSYSEKRQALLHASFTMNTATEAWIYGTHGSIHLHGRFHHPKRLTLLSYDGDSEEIEMDYKGFGYQFEAMALMRCLDKGVLECPEHSLDDTLLLMELLDALRHEIGLEYPEV